VRCVVHGTGEFFIRAVVAYDVAALMKYRGMSLADATAEVVKHKLKTGTGGLIALDSKGTSRRRSIRRACFTDGLKADGTVHIEIFED